MRDGERSERLLTCRTASNGYKHFSAVKRVSRVRLLRIEMIYLDGCLARTQIVLNGGPVAVTAAPATGRLNGRSLTTTAPPRELASTSEGGCLVSGFGGADISECPSG